MQHEKKKQYRETFQKIQALIQGETDEIAIMSTAACELHGAMDYFDWTGFYRVVAPNLLKVGPYQGSHGCLVIPFSRGVCGAAASTRKTQLIADVSALPHHIACSSTTQSEIVVPLLDSKGQVRAVLDVDSDRLNAFDEMDQQFLEKIATLVAKNIWD